MDSRHSQRAALPLPSLFDLKCCSLQGEHGERCTLLHSPAQSSQCPPPHHHHHCHKLLVFVWWWWRHEEAGMAHHGRTMALLRCCPLCIDLCIVPPPGPPFATHAQPAGTEMAALLTRFTMALVVQATMEGHGHRHLCGTQGGLGWGWAGGATTTSLRGGCWQRKKIPIVNGGCLCAAQRGGGGAEVLPQCGGAVTDGWMWITRWFLGPVRRILAAGLSSSQWVIGISTTVGSNEVI